MPRSKSYTKEQARAICRDYETGEYTQQELAYKYESGSANQDTISQIIRGEYYDDIQANGGSKTVWNKRKSVDRFTAVKICQQVAAGTSRRELSERFGVSRWYVDEIAAGNYYDGIGVDSTTVTA